MLIAAHESSFCKILHSSYSELYKTKREGQLQRLIDNSLLLTGHLYVSPLKELIGFVVTSLQESTCLFDSNGRVV
jgi:hypothetical protein